MDRKPFVIKMCIDIVQPMFNTLRKEVYSYIRKFGKEFDAIKRRLKDLEDIHGGAGESTITGTLRRLDSKSATFQRQIDENFATVMGEVTDLKDKFEEENEIKSDNIANLICRVSNLENEIRKTITPSTNRKGRVWEEEEEEQLRSFFDNFCEDAAIVFGRTPLAVFYRLRDKVINKK